MRNLALFMNGIYSGVLDEILNNQAGAPNKTLFLQPYSSRPIVMLRNAPPAVDDPVKLYVSTTDSLATVSYTADIVGWEDKTKMNPERRAEVDGIIHDFQPEDDHLYDHASASGGQSLNLLSIQNLVRLTSPFSVAELVKDSDGRPLAINRSRSGGWSAVSARDVDIRSPLLQTLAHQEATIEDSGFFDPHDLPDARERVAASIVRRRGQTAFRQKLLEAYGGCCAVTGCDVEDVLEACHIIPYKGPETNHPANGVLLRADLHVLFDLGLISFDSEAGRVVVSADLRGTHYESLEGTTFNVPSDPALRPSAEALSRHRRGAG